jgi:cysteine-S-conjugate beta-lyase
MPLDCNDGAARRVALSGVFSVVFKPGPSQQQVYAFVDALHLFKVGYSWAGVTSLAVAYDIGKIPGRPPHEHRIVRLNIGLESTSDRWLANC